LVLDNTYVSRASRHDVVRTAHGYGRSVRCVFIDTPLPEAQVNVVTRLLDRFGRLPEPKEIAALARQDAAAIGPHALFRMMRALEPPEADEGFDVIEVVAFERVPPPGAVHPCTVFALEALGAAAGDLEPDADAIDAVRQAAPDAPCLVYGWRPGADQDAPARARAFAVSIGQASGRHVEIAMCSHPGGPPQCWCRPPLPGLCVQFALRHGAYLGASVLVGRSPTDRAMAKALRMSFRERP
jgi:hypothetical protein